MFTFLCALRDLVVGSNLALQTRMLCNLRDCIKLFLSFSDNNVCVRFNLFECHIVGGHIN